MSTRVMIIDDDENTLKLMRVLLEAKGYQVRTYRQPEAAFAALDRFEPTVIVINWISCGEERGPRLLYQLRGRMLTAMTPVVVASGAIHQLQGIRDRLQACGVSIVYKPFTLDDFLSSIQAALSTARRPRTTARPS